jgi:hypothetical protein
MARHSRLMDRDCRLMDHSMDRRSHLMDRDCRSTVLRSSMISIAGIRRSISRGDHSLDHRVSIAGVIQDLIGVIESDHAASAK